MKLWIDDFRDAPDSSWTEVRKVEPAIRLIAMYGRGGITDISLDHDIENRPDDETFKPVAYFLGEKYYVALEFDSVPNIKIHSDNPVGAKEMQAIFKDFGFDIPWEPFTSDKEFKTKYGLT